MGTTTLSGPLLVGPNKDPGDSNNPFNQGFARLSQSVNISFNATVVSEQEIFVPPGCRIESFLVDVLTVFNSGTSATLSAGITSGATTYMGSVDVHTAAGRIAPTFTAAQLGKMSSQSILGVADPIPGPVFLTVTSVGQPTAGYITVSVLYSQIA